VENKERVIVGMNEFIDEEDQPIEIFRPPKNTEEKQKRKLRKLREKRNDRRVKNALLAVEKVAQTDNNLVPVLVDAVKNYATLGEISDVLRNVFGEYCETG
jgi:methylmalonyl-CoA mutase N-terminal domain/subunit